MDDKQYFKYGEKEIEYLKLKDPVLGKAIDEIGYVHREVIPDVFKALINSIIGQQISTKAQVTIWERFLIMFAPVTPEHIHSMTEETIQTCGISMRKAAYIKGIASSILDGSLDLPSLQALPDEAVCRRLSELKGIGIWTAQMMLIFSMQRMDVISPDDIAIIRGLRMLYRHRNITPKLFRKYQRRYSPYGTIASFYLWQIAQGACPELIDRRPQNRS